MGLETATKNQQVFNVSADIDEDGHPKRTGNIWTASAHIITAVIGTGVLSLAWAIAQLGWIAGPFIMILFSAITYYTSTLLSACYRSGDPLTGKRNYTYMDAVRANLGRVQVKICGAVQAVRRSNCFHSSGGKNPCHMNSNPYMIAFGITEIILSQIPRLAQLWWLSIVAAVMSFTYSSIGLALGVAKVAESGKIKGSVTGMSTNTMTQTQKVLRSFQALGGISFAYSFSIILIEIQDTLKSPPSESKTINMASLISVGVTTVFYMLCGCMGYAAFGDLAPGNLLTGFGFYNPYWLLDIANVAVVIHIVGAYQLYCQPIYALIEKVAAEKFPNSEFITREIKVPIPGFRPYNLNLFRLIFRTIFVITTTVIAMVFPFFNDVVGLLGGFGFWPLTVYFPVEMYIAQKKIPKWRTRWLCLQILSAACLMITIASSISSVAGIVFDLKTYKPFKTNY